MCFYHFFSNFCFFKCDVCVALCMRNYYWFVNCRMDHEYESSHLYACRYVHMGRAHEKQQSFKQNITGPTICLKSLTYF